MPKSFEILKGQIDLTKQWNAFLQLIGNPTMPGLALTLHARIPQTCCRAKTLNCTEQWPFFDIAAIAVGVDPSQRADNAQVEVLRHHFSQAPFYTIGIMENTCEWFLHWQVVKNQPEVRKFNLPDPYEPLIILYERGGIFATEHGFFNFEAASFPRGTWMQHDRDFPVVQLESAALARLDCYSGDRVLVN